MKKELAGNAIKKAASRLDVAKAAGVSHMTVTRVLQNHPYVTRETQRRVLDACAKLNYQPNLLASYLATKRSYALGVVCPTLEHGYFVQLVQRIEETASNQGYHIIVIQLPESLPTKEKEAKLDFLLQRQVDGLIIACPMVPELSRHLASKNIPVILTEQVVDGFVSVCTDDFNGAKEATSYLISLGHRKIAHLMGAPGYTATHRFNGYRRALDDAGIPFADELVLETNYSMSGGFRAIQNLLRHKTEFTAVFAANDHVAFGALTALSKNGIRVPDDISVVGFSDDPVAEYSVPPLTTVHQPVETVASKTVGLILERMNTPNSPNETVLVSSNLVVRDSCRKI